MDDTHFGIHDPQQINERGMGRPHSHIPDADIESTMPKLQWATSRLVEVGPYKIPCVEDIDPQFGSQAGWDQVAGIRTDNPRTRAIKGALWPAVQLRDAAIGNAYCHRTVGRWVCEFADDQTTFLEIGCGPLSLRKYLPAGVWYNGMDIAFSEFQVRRALGQHGRVPANVAMASATNIPLPDGCVSLLGSCEVFMHIPDFDRAAAEMRRVTRSGGMLACSIANVGCHKYKAKGVNSDFVQNWSFDGFADTMSRHGFELVRREMKGWWIPLPSSVCRASYHLPFSSRDEVNNCNFMYLFRARN